MMGFFEAIEHYDSVWDKYQNGQASEDELAAARAEYLAARDNDSQSQPFAKI